ncbi:hypothetical protein Hanom_Chr08g00735521 [Helianthus anomalus]
MFRRPLSFFTRNKDISLGDIIRWCWIPELKVITIHSEYGVRHFRNINHIKSLPWWNVTELCQTRLINYELSEYNQMVLRFIKKQAKNHFRWWKPQQPKRIVMKDETDPGTGKPKVILKYK